MLLLIIILLIVLLYRGAWPVDVLGIVLAVLLIFLLLGFIGPFYPHRYPYW